MPYQNYAPIFMVPTSQSIPITSPSLLYLRKKCRTLKFRGGLYYCQNMALQYNIVRVKIIFAQKEFPDILQSLPKDSDDYTLIKGRLFSISLPSLNSACYPRLVLPGAYRERVIKRADKKVRHMATGKTLSCLREAFVWP